LSRIDREQHCQPKIYRRGSQETLDVLIVPNLACAVTVIKLARFRARIVCDQSTVVRPRKNAVAVRADNDGDLSVRFDALA
jgi:hypothetical protein